MCERCALVVRKYYPSLPDEDFGDFLMSTTSFPMGDPDNVERQVREMWEATDGTISAAYRYAGSDFEKESREWRGIEEYESWSGCAQGDAI